MSLKAPNTPIKPADIKLDRVLPLPEAFRNLEKEYAAARIVLFCQTHNGNSWQPFKLKDFQRHFPGQGFNGLDTDGYVKVEGNMVAVTERFVAKCYLAVARTD